MQMKTLLLIFSFGLLNFVHGQTYPRLAKVLTKELPNDSTKDGRWVFYADNANIEKLNKPLVKATVPNYDFYQVGLTNYLGWHVNQGTCLILFDSIKSKIILIEPLWYNETNEDFIKLFIGQKFDNKESLLNFLQELNELLEVGSGYKFRNTGYADNLITYDLGYFKDDTYTTGGNGTRSTIHYNEDGVWRKIKIDTKDLKIIKYTSLNPKMPGK